MTPAANDLDGEAMVDLVIRAAPHWMFCAHQLACSYCFGRHS
jgi:hypothetical protein